MIYINNGQGIGVLSLLLICLFCIILTSPFFSSLGTETMLLTLLSCLLMFYNGYNAISDASKKLILLYILFFAVMIWYKIMGFSSADWLYPAGYMGWMFASVLGCYLINNANYSQMKILFGVIYTACVVYCGYISIIGNRVMRGGSELGVDMATAMFSSAYMLFSGSCLILFLNAKRVSIKILSFFGFFIAAYANFVVLQRGTNAIFSVILYAMILLFNGKRSRVVYGLFFLLQIALVIFFQTGLYIDVFDRIESIISSERIATRIHSLNIFLQTGDFVYAGTSVRTRGLLLIKTWSTFTSSFPNILVGVGDHRNFGGPIGNHNELIDMLARYGVLFSTLLYIILIKQHAWFKEIIWTYKNNRIYHQATAVFLIYIARNIIGGALSTAVSIQMFLFLPIVIILIQKQNVFNINQYKNWRFEK